MKNLLYVGSLLILLACSGKEKSNQTAVADSIDSTVEAGHTQPVDTSSDKSPPKNRPVIGADKWLYEQTVDQEGHTVYKASITSPNLLNFGFPYAGGSTTTLTIRKRESGTNVYVHVSKGQFNRSFQGGNARIRFDQNPPRTYSFSAAENGSANIIFFDSEQALIDKMKTAQKMIIDVEFYAQGNRQLEFKTADLNWNH